MWREAEELRGLLAHQLGWHYDMQVGCVCGGGGQCSPGEGLE